MPPLDYLCIAFLNMRSIFSFSSLIAALLRSEASSARAAAAAASSAARRAASADCFAPCTLFIALSAVSWAALAAAAASFAVVWTSSMDVRCVVAQPANRPTANSSAAEVTTLEDDLLTAESLSLLIHQHLPGGRAGATLLFHQEFANSTAVAGDAARLRGKCRFVVAPRHLLDDDFRP